MKTQFQPLGSRALVQRIEYETKSIGGLILSDGAQKQALSRARVLAVGKGHFKDGVLRPVPFGEGAVVVFPSNFGDEIVLDGERLLIICETDVVGVIES